MKNILAINFGSTSTKVAFFEDENMVHEKSLSHNPDDLLKYHDVHEQYDMRKAIVHDFLEENNLDLDNLDIVVAAGGLLPKPVKSGAYMINEQMIDDLMNRPLNRHPNNLSPKVAYEICNRRDIPAMVYDCATVDERDEEYKITGVPEIKLDARGHILNTRAKAIRVCKEKGWDYKEKTIIVVHMGGGTGANIHINGRIADAISDDIGPFSPTRMGGVPGYDLVKLAMSGKYDFPTLMKKLQRQSGLYGHLGTTDVKEVEERIKNGDKQAELVLKAMAILIAKAIGQLATDTNGNVDQIVLTGGIANSKLVTKWILERVEFIAPVSIMPGEEEMEALAAGALRVIRGEEELHIYD